MPDGMQYLPRVVQRIHWDLISSLLVAGHHLLVPEDLAQCVHVPRCLVRVVLPEGSVKDTEKVVVSSCDDFAGRKKMQKTSSGKGNKITHDKVAVQ